MYFLADPFIVDAEKKIIVAEYYHFFKRFGELVLLQFDEAGDILWMKKLNSKSAHYSYPFLLKDNVSVFIFPESSLDGCQKRIELDVEGMEIIKEYEAISGISIVDGTIIKHEQEYYFFANPSTNFNDELWIYKANNISGPWDFLLKINGKNLRGAGNFFHLNGKLYRPSQMNEKNYGGGLIFNEVMEINPSHYLEKEVDRFLPLFKNNENISGSHTLNMDGSLLVTDIRYEAFLWWKPISKIISKVRQTIFS